MLASGAWCRRGATRRWDGTRAGRSGEPAASDLFGFDLIVELIHAHPAEAWVDGERMRLDPEPLSLLPKVRESPVVGVRRVSHVPMIMMRIADPQQRVAPP